MATPRSPRKRSAKAASEEEKAQDAVVSAEEGSDLSIEDAVVVPESDVDAPAADEPSTDTVVSEPEGPTPETPTEMSSQGLEDIAEPAVLPPPPAKSGSGFFGTLLGGILAAAIGFGLARYVVPEGWPLPGNTPLQDQLTEQSKEIESLGGRLEALSNSVESGPDETLSAEFTTLRETAAAALETAEAAKAAAETPHVDEALVARVVSIEERVTAIEEQPLNTSTADPAALNRLKADIQALRSDLESQKAASEKAAADATAAAEAARAEATAEAQDVLLRASIAKVEAAMQSGAPYADALEQLSAAGLDIPSELSESADVGLVTVATLSEGFAEPARVALEETLRGDMGDTMAQRLGSFFRSQTGARSLTPREGDDPDAVLSRAEAAANAGDLATALSEISKLPESAQAALAEWVAQAQHRVKAQEAIASLSAALGER